MRGCRAHRECQASGARTSSSVDALEAVGRGLVRRRFPARGGDAFGAVRPLLDLSRDSVTTASRRKRSPNTVAAKSSIAAGSPLSPSVADVATGVICPSGRARSSSVNVGSSSASDSSGRARGDAAASRRLCPGRRRRCGTRPARGTAGSGTLPQIAASAARSSSWSSIL